MHFVIVADYDLWYGRGKGVELPINIATIFVADFVMFVTKKRGIVGINTSEDLMVEGAIGYIGIALYGGRRRVSCYRVCGALSG